MLECPPVTSMCNYSDRCRLAQISCYQLQQGLCMHKLYRGYCIISVHTIFAVYLRIIPFSQTATPSMPMALRSHSRVTYSSHIIPGHFPTETIPTRKIFLQIFPTQDNSKFSSEGKLSEE